MEVPSGMPRRNCAGFWVRKHAISSTTSQAKAQQAKALGSTEVIDYFSEKLADGVRRITEGYERRLL